MFTLKLTAFDEASKMNVIKEVKNMLSVGDSSFNLVKVTGINLQRLSPSPWFHHWFHRPPASCPRQARGFIGTLPGTLKTEVPKEEAEKIVAKFKEIGATVTMA